MNFELIDANSAPVGSLTVKVEEDEAVVSRSSFVSSFLWKIDKSRGYALIAAAQAGLEVCQCNASRAVVLVLSSMQRALRHTFVDGCSCIRC
jgi:hypothetical protein